MLIQTADRLRCPRCKSADRPSLAIVDEQSTSKNDITTGTLSCVNKRCRARYPILAGVAVVVSDPDRYLLEHVKGIAPLISESELPRSLRDEFCEARDALQEEHIEEDLESARVTALYVMNHYLSAGNDRWWSDNGAKSHPLIERLIQEHWDQGPFQRIERWAQSGKLNPRGRNHCSILELGCGVGGLSRRLQLRDSNYLGIDSSFASISLARHFSLGTPRLKKVFGPGDLLDGAVSRLLKVSARFDEEASSRREVDFVVGEVNRLCVAPNAWDVCVSLNMIDMLEDPEELARVMQTLLKKQAVAIQGSPYVWHPVVAKRLRKRVGPKVTGSAAAVEKLFQQNGFEVEEREEHLPWLFFKHARQLEVYSVHLFLARKS